MKSNLITHFEAKKKELLATLTDDQRRTVAAWERDDAGVDLEGFFKLEDGMDDDVTSELQFLIGAIGEVQFLEERAQKLDKIEKALGILLDAIKE